MTDDTDEQRVKAQAALAGTRRQFVQMLPSYIPPEPFRWLGAKITR